MNKLLSIALAFIVGSVTGQVENPVEADVTPMEYMDGNQTLLGHLSLPDTTKPAPAVIIIPDWDGVNEYEHVRATMIAKEWGMVGFAADIYGADLQFVEDFSERGQLATFYRSNPDVFGSRINTAIEFVKSMPEVNSERVALFGYCFGGTGVLQYGLYGNDDIESIVSFHGGLSFLPEEPMPFGPKLLVQSGGDDDDVADIMDLEITLDTAGASWEITRYSDIEHAFTVFEDERYNAWVDMRSWEAAYDFILESFGMLEYTSALPTPVKTLEVDYIDITDNKELRGHLALPSDDWARPLPAVVILPDWDGANEYERERASALAELGYVAMVADIYGADKQFVESFEERGQLVGQYSGDPELYVSRMTRAIEQLKSLTGDVDANEMAMIGYCFGGSGAIVYSFLTGADMKVSVAFHGSLSMLPPVMVEQISPYLLILSGGDDELHGNQTIMESAFNEGNATWEITRYSGVDHGYTLPSSEAFNLEADARSWESMLTTFQELLAQPQTTGMNTPGPNMEDDEETGDPEDNSAAGRWSSAMCALAAGAIVLAL